MHYFHRADTAVDYARTASCRTTEVIALPGYGDRIRIQADEDHYLNVFFPTEEEIAEEEAKSTGMEPGEDSTGDRVSTLDEGPDPLLSEDDPFLESDLPVSSLADETYREGEEP